ncbi:MAG: hypothetical protein ACIAS6_15520 [Phycisphaerales bacterium JB060]
MSDNPYAQPQDFASGPEYLEPKTSFLAIFAFIVSLLGLLGCCIPGIGPLGLLLGVLALVLISMSGGRKKGGGLAIAAIIIGLIAGAINIATLLAASWVAEKYAGQADVIPAIERGEADAVRGYLTSDAASDLTDARVAEVQRELAADWGPSRARAQGMLELWGQFRTAGPVVESGMEEAMAEYPQGAYQVMPVPIEFENGLGYVFMVSSPGQPTFPPAAENMAFLRSDGTLLWLLPPPSAQGTPAPALPGDPGDSPDASDPGSGGDEPGGG